LIAQRGGLYRTLSELQFDVGESERVLQNGHGNGSTGLASSPTRQLVQ
jgi:hypothetical protein